MSATTRDVIVIGGGLHGAATAFHLARRGVKTLVLERSAVARHASGASAGGVRTLGRDVREIPLSLIAAEMWRHIRDLVNDDCGYHEHGQFLVAETETERAELLRRQDETRALGHTHERLIGADDLRRLLPAVAPHCVAALTVETDGAADPYQTTHAFRRRAEDLGAHFREGEGVTAIRRIGQTWSLSTPVATYESPVIVNCAGAWADQIAAMVGDAPPLETRCAMMIVTERLPPFVEGVVGAVGRKLSFKQAPNGTVLIGGGHQGRPDRERESYELDTMNLAASAVSATALFPRMRDVRIVRAWAGLEAQTPDVVPVIGASPNAPGVFHAFGFSGHGFQLGPVVGSAIADLIISGSTNLPIAPFALSRFATG